MCKSCLKAGYSIGTRWTLLLVQGPAYSFVTIGFLGQVIFFFQTFFLIFQGGGGGGGRTSKTLSRVRPRGIKG